MTDALVKFYLVHRNIFGICPRSGQLFRLNDCRVYLRTRPQRDWMDQGDAQEERLERMEDRLDEQEEGLRERARERGRRLAQRAIRRIDPVFAPYKLNADDAKVIFHPVDYIVFDGMKEGTLDSFRRIVLLDRNAQSEDRRKLQRSIARAVERQAYEWRTLRIAEDGNMMSAL